MALIAPTPWMQNSGLTNSAQLLRIAAAGLAKGNVTGPATIGPRSGCAPQSFIASQNGTGNMSVNVAAGLALVNGSEAFAQGGYWVVNDATTNLAVGASHATLSRTDSVYLAIQDSFYSGASNQAVLAIAAGSTATPTTPPTLPANSLELWRINVRAGTSSILTSDLTSRRPWLSALGGIWQANSFELSLGGQSDYDFRFDLSSGKLDRWDTSTGTWQNILQYGNTSHLWYSDGINVNPNSSTTVNDFTQSRSAGIATMTSGQNLKLNRAGKWALTLRHFSDTGSDGRMAVMMDWTNGPWLDPMEDNSYRASGWANAGELRKTIHWSGYVTAAQAAQVINVKMRWSPANGTNILANNGNTNALYVEYLGG